MSQTYFIRCMLLYISWNTIIYFSFLCFFFCFSFSFWVKILASLLLINAWYSPDPLRVSASDIINSPAPIKGGAFIRINFHVHKPRRREGKKKNSVILSRKARLQSLAKMIYSSNNYFRGVAVKPSRYAGSRHSSLHPWHPLYLMKPSVEKKQSTENRTAERRTGRTCQAIWCTAKTLRLGGGLQIIKRVRAITTASRSPVKSKFPSSSSEQTTFPISTSRSSPRNFFYMPKRRDMVYGAGMAHRPCLVSEVSPCLRSLLGKWTSRHLTDCVDVASRSLARSLLLIFTQPKVYPEFTQTANFCVPRTAFFLRCNCTFDFLLFWTLEVMYFFCSLCVFQKQPALRGALGLAASITNSICTRATLRLQIPVFWTPATLFTTVSEI